jgi:hypothetical protein
MPSLSSSPGSGADSTAVFGLYKDVFEEGIAEGVNNSNPLGDIFKPEKVDYKGGKGHTFEAHVGRNPSPMFVAEDGAFAGAGAQRHINGNVHVRKMMARIRLTQEAMDDSVSSEASWRSAKKDEMTRIIDDIAKREEFALSCDGRGILCLLSGDPGTSANPVEVDSPGNIAGANFGNRFIQVGMYIGAVNPATARCARASSRSCPSTKTGPISPPTRRSTRHGRTTTISSRSRTARSRTFSTPATSTPTGVSRPSSTTAPTGRTTTKFSGRLSRSTSRTWSRRPVRSRRTRCSARGRAVSEVERQRHAPPDAPLGAS